MTVSTVEFLYIESSGSGEIWGSSETISPRPLLSSFHDFCSTGLHDTYSRVRTRGSQRNADMILHLSEMRQRDEIDELQICSPTLGGSRYDVDDPVDTLHRVASYPSLSASRGGWRSVTEADRAALSLAVLADNMAEGSGNRRRGFLVSHPIWPYLSFLQGGNIDDLARVVGLIVDPRFFVDDKNPDDMTNRLESYLGIAPKSTSSRVRLVDSAIGLSGLTSADRARLSFRPGGFLLRRLRSSGIRSARRMFVSYLTQCWLSVINKGLPELCFSPKNFFTESEVVDAMKAHLEDVSRR